MQQMANIRTILGSGTLVEFTFRDDTGNTRNYYVRSRITQGEEKAGHDERGRFALQLIGLHSLA